MKYQNLAKCIIYGSAAVMIYLSMPLCKDCAHVYHLPHLLERQYSTNTSENARNVYVSGIFDSTTTTPSPYTT